MTLEAIKYKRGKLSVLNQLDLPHKSEYEEIQTVQDGWNAIKLMKVRGAPAIAIVGCLSFAVVIYQRAFSSVEELCEFVEKNMNYLVTARPTAVNLSKAANNFIKLSRDLAKSGCLSDEIKIKLVEEAEMMLIKDVSDNKQLSDHGAIHIIKKIPDTEKCSILTHCNTGSLATAGYGTALGVVRSLHARGCLDHVYFTETRPYNQGARLTAYELVHDGIPATLIADSMVGLLMKSRKISAVVVGADRVARNGDTANKIGTYQIAVLAKYHNVPFYVAAPSTCHCGVTDHGDDIIIEERCPTELKSINGVRLAPDEVGCWNPSFDVTPSDLITGGIITENGVFLPRKLFELCSQAYINKQ